MFQPIEVSDMQFRQKYKIVCNCEYYGMFTGIMYKDAPIQYLIFMNVYNETNQVHVPSKIFVSTVRFSRYVSQKAKIQSDMEMRSLNLVVRRIIGDDHFTW
jgi:hypothetical protein